MQAEHHQGQPASGANLDVLVSAALHFLSTVNDNEVC